jgi:hypothetical protein
MNMPAAPQGRPDSALCRYCGRAIANGDKFFCTDAHARMLGYMAAEMGYRTSGYDKAALASRPPATVNTKRARAI